MDAKDLHDLVHDLPDDQLFPLWSMTYDRLQEGALEVHVYTTDAIQVPLDMLETVDIKPEADGTTRGKTMFPWIRSVATFLYAWLNHFLINIGLVLSGLFFAIVPPQWTGHDDNDIRSLCTMTPWESFWFGLAGDDREGEES